MNENSAGPQRIAVTGGAGFIGSALIRHLMSATSCRILNIDKLTYAGNTESLAEIKDESRYHLATVDICDLAATSLALEKFRPDAILHLAAESHVDRSIDGPGAFIQTNIVGTYTLLEAALRYWQTLTDAKKKSFRFLHVSTDEVFGSLGDTGAFTEETPYAPRSPYSASKASSDHIVRAWDHTYGLPTLITNCSNNYGPYQFPEKLIPVTVLNAAKEQPLPVYGQGSNVRDWLYVNDHVKGILKVLQHGRLGETYAIGGNSERTNLDLVKTICGILDQLRPRSGGQKYAELISFVTDRPGHDHRYAIDSSKIRNELHWAPEENLDTGLHKTVAWYLDNAGWVKSCAKTHVDERLGLARQK